MAELEQRLGSLKEEFSELEDGFERYSYLMELGSYLPPYPGRKKNPRPSGAGMSKSGVDSLLHQRGSLFLRRRQRYIYH